jgi:hypothetical protein
MEGSKWKMTAKLAARIYLILLWVQPLGDSIRRCRNGAKCKQDGGRRNDLNIQDSGSISKMEH